jgi:hypothetical protein
MITKTNLDHIKEKTNECAALAGRIMKWIEDGDGDGTELAADLWRAIGFERDGKAVIDGLSWSISFHNFEGYEAGIKLIYNECVKESIDSLPEWVRVGMRANYTTMLATVYGVDECEINKDVDTLRSADKMLEMCINVAGDARDHGANR